MNDNGEDENGAPEKPMPQTTVGNRHIAEKLTRAAAKVMLSGSTQVSQVVVTLHPGTRGHISCRVKYLDADL